MENDAFSALKENWPVKFRIFFAEHKGELSDITIKELAEWFGESKVKSVLSSEFSNMFERYAVNKNTLENILRDKDKLKELPELNQKLLQKFFSTILVLKKSSFTLNTMLLILLLPKLLVQRNFIFSIMINFLDQYLSI